MIQEESDSLLETGHEAGTEMMGSIWRPNPASLESSYRDSGDDGYDLMSTSRSAAQWRRSPSWRFSCQGRAEHRLPVRTFSPAA